VRPAGERVRREAEFGLDFMGHRASRRGALAAARAHALIVVLLLAVCVPVGAGEGYQPPRIPGGTQPDLNGIWQTINEANYDVERHMARPSMHLREGPHGPVPSVETLALGAVASVPPGMGVVVGGRIPYTPEALAIRDENRADWINRDPEIKCYLPGVPRATYMPHPFQIVQSADSLLIIYQYAGAVREVYFQDPGPAPIDSWMGQSVGHWDGDTLVVEVTGQHDMTWFDRAGNHHSDELKVVERYTPMSPYHLHYEARIEDARTFTEPWTISMPIYRRMEPNARILDFNCIEFVEELLYGQYRRNPLDR
jgi:hypothetical protein